jgi:hypothetical protein
MAFPLLILLLAASATSAPIGGRFADPCLLPSNTHPLQLLGALLKEDAYEAGVAVDQAMGKWILI